MTSDRMILVVNPNAGSAKSRARIGYLMAALQEQSISLKIIQALDAESANQEIANEIGLGAEWLITAGGDGTVYWTVNCLMNLYESIRDRVKYAHFPVGTGNDWGRTYKVPHDAKSWVKGLMAGKLCKQDLGTVEWQGMQGSTEKRYFANVAGMAFDGLVARIVEMESKGKKHSLIYLQAALKSLFRFKNPRLRVQSDEFEWEGKALTVNVGICKYSGGKMQIVPHADPNDGMLALTIAGDFSPAEVVVNIAKLFNGKLGNLHKVQLSQHHKISVSAAKGESYGPVWLEADGEMLGNIPATFGIIPQAIQVLDFR